MKIGIIGAGFVGRAIWKAAAAAGHEVMLSNSRGPETLFTLRYGFGANVGMVEDAIGFGDIVVLGIPLPAYRTLPVDLLAGKIVLDANNYYPDRDGRIAELDNHQTTTSEMLAAHLSKSRIVKAFNAVIMADLETDGLPASTANRRALPLAGDDAEAKALVSDLYDQFGFDTVDAGPLAEGWRFERDRPAYCVRMTKPELEKTLRETKRVTALAA